MPLTKVDAANLMTGVLPVANGGTGASSTTFCNLATNVTGTLPEANGASTIVARDASGNFTANNITANGDVTSSSDERLKTNWVYLAEDFVKNLSEVKSGIYQRIDTGEIQAGVGAQSLANILPEATKLDENGMMTIAYGQAALVAAVELAKQVVKLQKEIEDLKKGR